MSSRSTYIFVKNNSNIWYSTIFSCFTYAVSSFHIWVLHFIWFNISQNKLLFHGQQKINHIFTLLFDNKFDKFINFTILNILEHNMCINEHILKWRLSRHYFRHGRDWKQAASTSTLSYCFGKVAKMKFYIFFVILTLKTIMR